MALNGQLDRASLSLVDGWAYLESNTARAWNAACAHMVRLGYQRPTITAPDGAYRDLAGQVYWKNYWTALGKPYNAATPGFSPHGLGKAVDIYKVYEFPRDTLRAVFAQYGFSFNVASEAWHCTHNGLTIASTVGTQISTSTPEDHDMYIITDTNANGGKYLVGPGNLTHIVGPADDVILTALINDGKRAFTFNEIKVIESYMQRLHPPVAATITPPAVTTVNTVAGPTAKDIAAATITAMRTLRLT